MAAAGHSPAVRTRGRCERKRLSGGAWVIGIRIGGRGLRRILCRRVRSRPARCRSVLIRRPERRDSGRGPNGRSDKKPFRHQSLLARPCEVRTGRLCILGLALGKHPILRRVDWISVQHPLGRAPSLGFSLAKPAGPSQRRLHTQVMDDERVDVGRALDLLLRVARAVARLRVDADEDWCRTTLSLLQRRGVFE